MTERITVGQSGACARGYLTERGRNIWDKMIEDAEYLYSVHRLIAKYRVTDENGTRYLFLCPNLT